MRSNEDWQKFMHGLDEPPVPVAPSPVEAQQAVSPPPQPAVVAPSVVHDIPLDRTRVEKIRIWWHRLPRDSATGMKVMLGVSVMLAVLNWNVLFGSWRQERWQEVPWVIGGFCAFILAFGWFQALSPDLSARIANANRLADEDRAISDALLAWNGEYLGLPYEPCRTEYDRDGATEFIIPDTTRRKRKLWKAMRYHCALLPEHRRPREVCETLARPWKRITDDPTVPPAPALQKSPSPIFRARS